jgi:hypothetical protein
MVIKTKPNNGYNMNNVRYITSRTFRNNRGTTLPFTLPYLTFTKINDLETNCKKKYQRLGKGWQWRFAQKFPQYFE